MYGICNPNGIYSQGFLLAPPEERTAYSAPTGYGVKQRQRPSPGMFFPGASALRKAEIAFHEYLGMAWAKIRGQIKCLAQRRKGAKND